MEVLEYLNLKQLKKPLLLSILKICHKLEPSPNPKEPIQITSQGNRESAQKRAWPNKEEEEAHIVYEAVRSLVPLPPSHVCGLVNGDVSPLFLLAAFLLRAAVSQLRGFEEPNHSTLGDGRWGRMRVNWGIYMALAGCNRKRRGRCYKFPPKVPNFKCSHLATVKFQVKFLTLQLSPPSGPLSATDG